MTYKILIIDDDTDAILILSTVLRDQGYGVITALDGITGLDMIVAEHPDLILLDLMMPEKSGISLLHDIKEDENLKDIPVIMVTGVASETGIDLESFLKSGSETREQTAVPRPDGYVQKPIDPNKLMTLIKSVLSR
jgi:CheY-like chemotaxis protein